MFPHIYSTHSVRIKVVCEFGQFEMTCAVGTWSSVLLIFHLSPGTEANSQSTLLPSWIRASCQFPGRRLIQDQSSRTVIQFSCIVNVCLYTSSKAILIQLLVLCYCPRKVDSVVIILTFQSLKLNFTKHQKKAMLKKSEQTTKMLAEETWII